jgi:hypothetical protein
LSQPLQYVKDNQRKWGSNCLEAREDRHLFQNIKVVKLKLPWPPLPKEKKLWNVHATANQSTSWTESQPISSVWTVSLYNINGVFSLERLWDPGIELFGEDELEYDHTSVEHLVDKLDIAETKECLPISQPKPQWSHLAPISFTNEFWSNIRTVSEPLHIIGITFQLKLNDFAVWCIFCVRPDFYSTLRNAEQLLGADICSQNGQKSTNLQNPSCWKGWTCLLLLLS